MRLPCSRDRRVLFALLIGAEEGNAVPCRELLNPRQAEIAAASKKDERAHGPLPKPSRSVPDLQPRPFPVCFPANKKPAA